MSKRPHKQIASDSTDTSTVEASCAAEGPPTAAAAVATATGSSHASSSSDPTAVIAPLPEQARGRKRTRHSLRIFSWMGVLATVEVQLVLRCLDVRSRLRVARCNKHLYAAASYPFAWPKEQLATLQVSEHGSALQALGGRVRRSLLRLSPIRLRVHGVDLPTSPWNSPEVFSVPNVHALSVLPSYAPDRPIADYYLSLLRHPAARELRSLHLSDSWAPECSLAELQQLQTLPHLHSLALGSASKSHISAALLQLAKLPALTHLSINAQWPLEDLEQLHSSLAHCTRLLSLRLNCASVCTGLVNCLAQLPLLRHLYLHESTVKKQSSEAWEALRSLCEIELNAVHDAKWQRRRDEG